MSCIDVGVSPRCFPAIHLCLLEYFSNFRCDSSLFRCQVVCLTQASQSLVNMIWPMRWWRKDVAVHMISIRSSWAHVNNANVMPFFVSWMNKRKKSPCWNEPSRSKCSTTVLALFCLSRQCLHHERFCIFIAVIIILIMDASWFWDCDLDFK